MNFNWLSSLKKLSGYTIGLYITSIIFFILLYLQSLPSITIHSTKVYATDNPELKTSVRLPYSKQQSDATKRFTFELQLEKLFSFNSEVRFIPDDCIEEITIDSIPVDLSHFPPTSRCDYSNGIVLNLSKLGISRNSHAKILVKIRNMGGAYGLTIKQCALLERPFFVGVVFFLCLFGLRIFRKHNVLRWTIVALIITLSISVPKRIDAHVYDTGAHEFTITYYHENHAMPSASLGGESHQPPLYYVLAALTFGAANSQLPAEECWDIIRYLNFVFFICFLFYGSKFIISAVDNVYLSTIGVIALFLWPSNILHCSRISNDILLYLLTTASVYHFWLWKNHRAVTHLSLCMAFLGGAFATKASSLLIAIPLAFIFVILKIRDRSKPLQHQARCAFLSRSIGIIIFLLGIAAGFTRNIVNFLVEDEALIFGAISQRYIGITLHLHEFLSFPYDTFISRGYLRTRDPTSMNEYFWNFFLKTVSFGEFQWIGQLHAIGINIFLLSMCLLTVLMFTYRFFVQKCTFDVAGFCLTLMFSLMAGLAAIKVIFYGHPWADARHIYPIVVFFLVAYLYLLKSVAPNNLRIIGAGSGLLLCYILLSGVHFYLQFFS